VKVVMKCERYEVTYDGMKILISKRFLNLYLSRSEKISRNGYDFRIG
jgi:hypothetical protein